MSHLCRASAFNTNRLRVDDIVSRNPVPFTLNVSGSKGSFLVWDKIYQKLGQEDEQRCLLNALEAVARYRDGALVSAAESR